VQYIGGMTMIFILIGAGAGVLAGLFGIGGGVVIVPALLYFARMSPLTATGTSLGALLLPVGLLGALEYYRNGHLDVRASLMLGVGLFLGAFFGAKMAQMLTPLVFKRAFSLLLVVVAIRMWVAK
jgi:uncharacterized protein